MGGCGAVRDAVVFDDLLQRTEFGKASPVLGHTRFGVRGFSMAGRFDGISGLPAFLQYLHGGIWISGSGNDSPDLAVCRGAFVPDWGENRRRDRARTVARAAAVAARISSGLAFHVSLSDVHTLHGRSHPSPPCPDEARRADRFLADGRCYRCSRLACPNQSPGFREGARKSLSLHRCSASV